MNGSSSYKFQPTSGRLICGGLYERMALKDQSRVEKCSDGNADDENSSVRYNLPIAPQWPCKCINITTTTKLHYLPLLAASKQSSSIPTTLLTTTPPSSRIRTPSHWTKSGGSDTPCHSSSARSATFVMTLTHEVYYSNLGSHKL